MGETADGALMFLPSEAVYAELHSRTAPHMVREGICGAGLDRVAHDLHGDAEHDARDPQGCADARTGGRDPQGAAACFTAMLSWLACKQASWTRICAKRVTTLQVF